MTNEMIEQFVNLNKMMREGFQLPGITQADVHKAVGELMGGEPGPMTEKVMKAMESHEPECDECDESLDTNLADMIEEAILEDDKDYLIKSLSTALMLTSRAAGFANTSATAHSIWVEM